MTRRISRAGARRLAVRAQGLDRARPARVTTRHVLATVRQIELLQIDSVNVLARSHYIPLFSRLGAYDQSLLDDVAYRRGRLYEAWAHEASLLPVETFPLMRWQHRYLAQRWRRHIDPLEQERPGYVEQVYAQVAECGPVRLADLADPGRRSGPWWGLAPGKLALEYLFGAGRICATRTPSFERVYDITERVLPADVLATPDRPDEEAWRELLLRSARALGIGTAADLVDYFRLHPPTCRPIVAALAREGALEEVAVEGWPAPAYVLPGTVVPRRVDARALLTPFDPICWYRPRAERLHDFHYRIEIYTPEPKRTYGYYVLPFLLGDRLVARVDVKADRKACVLRVPGAFAENGRDPAYVGRELRAALEELAGWLGLAAIEIGDRGDLVAALR